MNGQARSLKCPRPDTGQRSVFCRVGYRVISALVGLLGLMFTPSAAAQSPTTPAPPEKKEYLNKNVVVLPIRIDPRFRHEIREVQLYMKDNPARPWTLQDRALPEKTEFQFRTLIDGEYWFTLVTLDRQGRFNPPDLTQIPPALIVVIDRQPPQVEVRTLSLSPDGPTFKVLVTDANPNHLLTRFEYQTGDKSWQELEPLPDRPDTYVVPPQVVFTGMVRVTATDRAGNSTQREFHAQDCLPTPAPGGVVTQATSPLPRPTTVSATGMLQTTGYQATGPQCSEGPPLPARCQEPILPPVATAGENISPPLLPPQLTSTSRVMGSNPPPVPPPVVPPGGTVQTQAFSRPQMAPPGQLPGLATQNVAPAASLTSNRLRQVVNRPRVMLEYQIEQMGPSGIGRVEVWITRDCGQSWQRLCEDADRTSPVEVELPGEGEFGLALSVTNGRGFGGEPPQPGTPPEWVIEVDTIKPVAEFQAIKPLSGPEAGQILITWVARDRNLSAEPVELYYAPQREGPWHLIAKGIRNDGQYRWTAPPEVGGKVFLRMVVTDQAGNSCTCETEQPVLVNAGYRPRIRIIGVGIVPGLSSSPPQPK